MKKRTISLVIRKKINDWLESIEDKTVRDLAAGNTIVTGGSIASILLKESVNDFDVYFRDYKTTLAVAQYYLSRFDNKGKTVSLTDGAGVVMGGSHFVATAKQSDDPAHRIKIVVKSAGVAGSVETTRSAADAQEAYDDIEEQALEEKDEDGKPPYRPVFISTNAITLSNKIQIVIRFWGTPSDIHENYDYVHCTNYWTSWNSELSLNQPALESILAKELRYVGSRYPLCSIIRMRKFINRGWSINAGQILKMCMQLQSFDLTDPAVLEDQLTGVDQAYFLQVMAILKEKNPEKVNTAYLVEIIDRMF